MAPPPHADRTANDVICFLAIRECETEHESNPKPGKFNKLLLSDKLPYFVSGFLVFCIVIAMVLPKIIASMTPLPTTVRVSKLKITSTPMLCYDVQMPDGSHRSFVDSEPFGSLNEVMVSDAKSQTSAARFRNDPGGLAMTECRPDQAMLPLDDEDFALVRQAVDRMLNIEDLPWIEIGDRNMERKQAKATIVVPSLQIRTR